MLLLIRHSLYGGLEKTDAASFSVDAHMRVICTLEGSAYHSEVLDFELNEGDKWNFVLFH